MYTQNKHVVKVYELVPVNVFSLRVRDNCLKGGPS